MAHETMTTDTRTTAELTDDGELLPPTLRTQGDVREDLVAAVEAALEAEPNTMDDPRLRESEGADHHVAHLLARYNELPALDEDGDLLGWKAPYRAREDFEAALREHLPADVAVEAENSYTTVFYTEAR